MSTNHNHNLSNYLLTIFIFGVCNTHSCYKFIICTSRRGYSLNCHSISKKKNYYIKITRFIHLSNLNASMKHVYKEVNSYVNLVTNLDHHGYLSWTILQSLCSSFALKLQFDTTRVQYPYINTLVFCN